MVLIQESFTVIIKSIRISFKFKLFICEIMLIYIKLLE